MVRPVTVMGLLAPVPVRPPGLEVAVYPAMAAPPLEPGAVKVTLACVSPAVAVPMVGAPGTTAATLKERLTVGAALNAPLPAWSALIVHVPTVTKVKAPPEVMVHTPVVDEVKLTVRLDVEVALKVGVVPKFCAPGLVKVMVWLALGVTLLDALEAEPVPAELAAVTVKV